MSDFHDRLDALEQQTGGPHVLLVITVDDARQMLASTPWRLAATMQPRLEEALRRYERSERRREVADRGTPG